MVENKWVREWKDYQLESKRKAEENIKSIETKYNIKIKTNELYTSFYFELNGVYYRFSTHRLPNRYYNPTDPNSEKYRKWNLPKEHLVEFIKPNRPILFKKIIELLETGKIIV